METEHLEELVEAARRSDSEELAATGERAEEELEVLRELARIGEIMRKAFGE